MVVQTMLGRVRAVNAHPLGISHKISDGGA